MNPSLPNRMCKTVLVFLCIVSFHTTSFSQHLVFGNEKFRIETGLNFGPTFFLGDLGGNKGKGTTFIKDVNLELTRMMKGAFFTIYPADWIGFRVAGQYTHVTGEDYTINSTGVHESWRKQRNLDFKSHMWEAYAAIELFPTMMFNKYDDYDPRLKPYGFVGIGLFHFNPQGSITNSNGSKSWYKLHPLRTEGQGMTQYPDKKPYELTQLNIPMGFGIKYQLSERVNIGTELLYRKTFTDYIDDVSTTYVADSDFDAYFGAGSATAEIAKQVANKSQLVAPGTRIPGYNAGDKRGTTGRKDSYYSLGLKVSIRLGSSNNGTISCPIRF